MLSLRQQFVPVLLFSQILETLFSANQHTSFLKTVFEDLRT